ncbi:phage holin family protein [Novosphingobium sp.]|uniref:phage holin family protein n=1 Tax=Novosphingobium sp. TaxID=1874826 RepID=UPI001D2447E4|nr:phage holin family protein [Novosphingobium sp.]MBX9663715.1 phage holin family protein [Novosphingobium sp.]
MTEDKVHTEEKAAGNDSLLGGARALLEDGQTLLAAEIEFQKARAGFVLGRAKGILVLAALALVLLFFALMALVMGLLLALAPLLGPWGALAVVVLGLLALTGLSVLGVVRRIGAISRALRGKDGAA